MTGKKKTEKRPERDFRLRGFYLFSELAGAISLLLFGFVMLYFKQFFPWVPNPTFNFWLFVSAFVLHTVFFILHEIFRKRFIYLFNRYIFLGFFSAFIANTGGMESPFVFTLMFPLLVSTVDLDARSTKTIGFVVVTFLSLVTVLDPRFATDAVFTSMHIFQVVLYGIIAASFYKIVTETLRQKYEKDLANKKLLEVVELDRIKTVFITIAQHQLRTPLSGVRWALDNVLKEGKVPADTVPVIQESYDKVVESIAIVTEMLKTAESGAEIFKKAEKRSDIDIAALLDTVVSSLSYLAKKNKVEVVLNKEGQSTISADRDTLQPAIANVIDNAIRYSPNGKVSISIVGNAAQVKIEVIDSGVGIDPVDQQYIFERFFRGKNAIAIDPNESGIGLYSSKKVIEFYGGTIVFASNVGRGSTFTITLPK